MGTEPQTGQAGQQRWEGTPDLVWPRGWFGKSRKARKEGTLKGKWEKRDGSPKPYKVRLCRLGPQGDRAAMGPSGLLWGLGAWCLLISSNPGRLLREVAPGELSMWA